MSSLVTPKFRLLMGLAAVATSCHKASLSVVTSVRPASALTGKIVIPDHDGSALAEACDWSHAHVALHAIHDPVTTSQPIAQSPIDEKGQYRIDLKSGINFAVPSSFKVVVKGCAVFMSRILTHSSHQNISVGSSLLDYAIVDKGQAALAGMAVAQDISSPQKIGLLNKLNQALEPARTEQEAYRILAEDGDLSASFTAIFGMSPSRLKDMPPRVVQVEVPASAKELDSISLSAQLRHWDPEFVAAVQWKTETAVIGQSATVTYTPGANDQGKRVITLSVGKKSDGGSAASLPAFAMVTQSFPMDVSDDFPATPPKMTLVAPILNAKGATAVRTLKLGLVTGPGMAHCDSFSKLALTENSELAPADPKAYTIVCTEEGTQAIQYSLKSEGDGAKILRLWAMDAAGHVSKGSSVVSLTLQETPPRAFAITSPRHAVGSLTPTVAWVEAVGADHYSLKVGTNPECSQVLQEYPGVTGTSQTLSVLAEGSYYLCLTAVDNLGNATVAQNSGYPFTIDVTAPDPFDITAPSAGWRGNVTTPTVSWTAASGAATYELRIGGNSDCSALAQNHAGLPGTAYQLTTPLAEGTYHVCVRALDAAGNAVAARNDGVSFTVDVTGPGSFRINDATLVFNTTTPTVSWTAASDASRYSLAVGANATCTPASQSYPSITGTSQALSALAEGTHHVCLSAQDDVGNVTAATNTGLALKIDASPPVLSSLSVNGGSASTSNRFVPVSLQASDAGTNITAFCLRFNAPTAPLASDACWVAVDAPLPGLTPSRNLNMANYFFPLGLSPGAYTVYAWAKDAAGNVSTLGNAGAGAQGVDSFAITYTPGAPPVVTDIVAANSDGPATLNGTADTTFANGSDVFVKWRATGTNALGSQPVQLLYTVDDKTYVEIASHLANGANGGCTVDNPGTSVDDQATGCFRWVGGGRTGYFRIRVAVKDTSGLETFGGSLPLNVPNFKIIAGNTEPGLDASASSAMFMNDMRYSAQTDLRSFVVTSRGVVFFRDFHRGILMVDPSDGVLRLLIPATGVSSGDGGPVSSATITHYSTVIMDHKDRLLIWDNDRIRRVDTAANPMTIDTIIGGGASDVDTEAALSVRIPPLSVNYSFASRATFEALPDGRIVYLDRISASPKNGWRARIYHPGTGMVTSLTPSGTGDSFDAAADISLCAIFNFGIRYVPSTSTISQMMFQNVRDPMTPDCTGMYEFGMFQVDPQTLQKVGVNPPSFNWAQVRSGMNGEMYLVGRGGYSSTQIWKYDSGTNTFAAMVGTLYPGTCDDGTPALSCAIDPQDAFITATGTIYFMDRGRLRTLDQNGKVVTLLGQGFSFGDGGKATSARFGQVNSLDVSAAGKVVALDAVENRFREFAIDGDIDTIAGNGFNDFPNDTSLAKSQPILTASAGVNWDDFAMDPASGDIFYNGLSVGTHRLMRLDRGSGKWTFLAGGGSTPYHAAADGTTGSSLLLGAYPVKVMGYDATHDRVLVHPQDFDTGIWRMLNPMLKLYDHFDGRQTHLIGTFDTSNPTVYCADGTSADQCTIPFSYDGVMPRATYDAVGDRWLLLDYAEHKIRTIAVGGTIGTLLTLPRQATSFAYDRNVNLTVHNVFYCGKSGADWRLFRYDLTTATETALDWPIPSINCSGRSLVHDPGRTKLIFPFTQNNLTGIGMYLLP